MLTPAARKGALRSATTWHNLIQLETADPTGEGVVQHLMSGLSISLKCSQSLVHIRLRHRNKSRFMCATQGTRGSAQLSTASGPVSTQMLPRDIRRIKGCLRQQVRTERTRPVGEL